MTNDQQTEAGGSGAPYVRRIFVLDNALGADAASGTVEVRPCWHIGLVLAPPWPLNIAWLLRSIIVFACCVMLLPALLLGLERHDMLVLTANTLLSAGMPLAQPVLCKPAMCLGPVTMPPPPVLQRNLSCTSVGKQYKPPMPCVTRLQVLQYPSDVLLTVYLRSPGQIYPPTLTVTCALTLSPMLKAGPRS